MSKLTRIADARAAKTETVAFQIMAHAMFKAKAPEPTYEVDSKGRKIRVFTREFPCTAQDIRDLLINVRAVHEDEVLEALGKNVLSYQLSVGFLVRDARHPKTLHVTKKCAEAYDLPFFFGANTFFH